jgi:hypothetical protein
VRVKVKVKVKGMARETENVKARETENVKARTKQRKKLLDPASGEDFHDELGPGGERRPVTGSHAKPQAVG